MVKQSISRFAAESLHPAKATLTMCLRNPDLAEMATWLERVEPDRHDPTVVHLADDDFIRLYRTFITLVLLTRGIAE